MKLFDLFKKNKQQNNFVDIKYSKLDNIGKVKRIEIPDKTEIDNQINNLQTNVNNVVQKTNEIKNKVDNGIAAEIVGNFLMDFSDCLEAVDFSTDYVAIKFKENQNNKIISITDFNWVKQNKKYLIFVYIWKLEVREPNITGRTSIKTNDILFYTGVETPVVDGRIQYTINWNTKNVLTFVKKSDIDDYNADKTGVGVTFKIICLGVVN